MASFRESIEYFTRFLRRKGIVLSYRIHINEDENDCSLDIFDVDSSEHDKSFQDEIARLQTEISNIKSRCTIEAMNDFKQGNYGILKVVKSGDYEALKKINDELVEENKQLHYELQKTAITENLPCEPIAVAETLINAKRLYEHNTFMKAFTGSKEGLRNIYGISELRQIAEHLLVYCNNNKDEE